MIVQKLKSPSMRITIPNDPGMSWADEDAVNFFSMIGPAMVKRPAYMNSVAIPMITMFLNMVRWLQRNEEVEFDKVDLEH
mmetsp:Transcript_14465/g.17592  ORF Transcript_14465/g.17592 Transcript_14465/m.17592 type:complete len:80 (+) Transcript_14465:781-1020(+)